MTSLGKDLSPPRFLEVATSLRTARNTFNGGPQRMGLEKHPQVCTQGTEPLAPKVPAARLVIAPSQAFRLKSKPVGHTSRQAPRFNRGVCDLP